MPSKKPKSICPAWNWIQICLEQPILMTPREIFKEDLWQAVEIFAEMFNLDSEWQMVYLHSP